MYKVASDDDVESNDEDDGEEARAPPKKTSRAAVLRYASKTIRNDLANSKLYKSIIHDEKACCTG